MFTNYGRCKNCHSSWKDDGSVACMYVHFEVIWSSAGLPQPLHRDFPLQEVYDIPELGLAKSLTLDANSDAGCRLPPPIHRVWNHATRVVGVPLAFARLHEITKSTWCTGLQILLLLEALQLM